MLTEIFDLSSFASLEKKLNSCVQIRHRLFADFVADFFYCYVIIILRIQLKCKQSFIILLINKTWHNETDVFLTPRCKPYGIVYEKTQI